ncbi:MAG: Gfo/Idh/MocA family protein [Gaiella sp.]
MTALRLGLLSTAKINDAILGGAAKTSLVGVVAVGSRDAVKGEAYANEKGLSRSHGSYDALLADPEVDAVYISLPNGMHHEWTLRALAAGKHVLCEKPYTRHPAEVEEAYAAAAAAGRVFMEAFMYRHHPQIAMAREMIESGTLGRVRLIRAAFSFPLSDMGNIRVNADLEGGSLMDVGCYCVSGSRLMAGAEPLHVLGEQVLLDNGCDISFHGTMRFPDDVVAQFDCSFALTNRQGLEVVGDDGLMRLTGPWRADLGGRVEIVRADGTVETLPVPEADSYTCQLENLARAVAGDEPPLVDRQETLGQARTIEALYRSAANGAIEAL